MMRIARTVANSWTSTVIVLLLALFGIGCGSFFVSGNALNSMTVTPTSIFLKVGEPKQFTANGTTVNGDSKDVTSTAKWTTSSSGIASVSAGLVKAVGSGNATITASQDGITANGSVIVNNLALTSIAITPTSPTVASGSTTPLTATGTFEDNSTKPLTSQVAWSSDTTSVATVNSSGVVSGVATGTAKITATVTTTSSTLTSTVTVTVQ
jgi:trimeric autotransporter adhesin